MKKRQKLRRVDIQVSILTASIVVVSCVLIYILNYSLSYNDMINSLLERVNCIYEYLETELEESSFSSLNTKEDMDTVLYQNIKEMLENTKNTTGVRYLYTAKRTDDGRYIYLVDGLPADSADFRNTGDPIEPEIIPDIEKAYTGELVLPSRIRDTSWGYIFISYLPIHSYHQSGEIIGVVGVEFDASHQYKTFRLLKLATPVVIVLCCVIAVFLAASLFKRISNPAYKDLANTDMLTGLYNRNFFDVMLHNLEVSPDKSGIGFLSIDLDSLKVINDTQGHPAGDEYIRRGSAFVQQFILSPDILCRAGGDEFVAILHGKQPEQAIALRDSMLKALVEYNQSGNTPVELSVGCAVYNPTLDKSLADTLKRADRDMYVFKKRKKGVE